jgi:4-hydroxybenzoate polyprenyltransferase
MVVSLRPKQWYKNILLFVGIVFSANLLDGSMWTTTVLAFAYFCMMSGAEYLLNDILDIERDRAHPIKSQRPIASGKLKVPYALSFAVSLILLSLIGAYFTVNLDFFIISASYVVLVLLYSLIFKHYVIADVLVVSAGFVIRAVAGALAIDVRVSPWLIVCSFLLALFLAFGKRWHELATLSDEAVNHRPVLAEYSTEIVEQFTGITAGALVVAYLLYTTSTENDLMLITAPFAVYGIFRYLYLLRQKGVAAEPETVLKDKPILISLGLWGLTVISIVMYEARS